MKFISDFKFNKNKILNNKQYLKKGWYVLLPNMRTYVNLFGADSKILHDFPHPQIDKKYYLKRIISLFYSFYVKTDGDFQGDIVYFSTCPDNFNRDCKVFSSLKKQVLFICANEKRYNLYIQNRQRNEELFPLPFMIESDAKNYRIIEEFIDHTEKDKDSVNITQRLFEFYSNYYNNCKLQGKCIFTDAHPEYLCEGIESANCPKLYLHHADLSSDNLMYFSRQDRIIFIDFDHENYYPPFYDVLFFILNQAFSCQDYRPLEQLNFGAYDEYIKDYATRENISPYTLIDSCLTYLKKKRYITYSQEKQIEIDEVLDKLTGRFLNG